MKKIILLMLSILFLCGCTKINEENMEKYINDIINSKPVKANNYNNGFKFYLPNTLNIVNSYEHNVVAKENDVTYYMFVDLISYYNNNESSYVVNKDAYYSKELVNDDKFGYIEINVKNDKYLIEIMYNYAKIELMVDEKDIHTSIVNSLIILSSINYNDDVISNMFEDDILNFSEETFSLFDSETDDSNFLKVVEEYDNYNEDFVPDYDYIKEN